MELKLKTPWRGGTLHLVMSLMEFMHQMAALVSRPRLHTVRFNGVLAPNAKLRPLVVPQRPPVQAHRIHRRHIDDVTHEPTGVALRAGRATVPVSDFRPRVDLGARACVATRDPCGRASRRRLWLWMDGRDPGSGLVSGLPRVSLDLPSWRWAFEFPMLVGSHES